MHSTGTSKYFYLLAEELLHHLSSRQKAHKAVTLSFQPALFYATILAILQLVQPALSSSFLTVLLQVILSYPLALRSSGLQSSAVTQLISPPLLRTWPSQFHLLRHTSQLTLLMSAILATLQTLLFVRRITSEEILLEILL